MNEVTTRDPANASPMPKASRGGRRGRREEELGSSGRAVSRFGQALRGWRKFRGLTVSELAIRAGFGVNGRGYISKIEHGVIQHVSDDRLQRLAQALDVSGVELQLRHPPTLPEVRDQTVRAASPSIDAWGLTEQVRQGDFLNSIRPEEGDSPPRRSRESELSPTSSRNPLLDTPPLDSLSDGALRRIDLIVEQLEANIIALIRKALRNEIRPLLLQLLSEQDNSDRERGVEGRELPGGAK